jgi:hypothetical protein
MRPQGLRSWLARLLTQKSGCSVAGASGGGS